MFSPEIRPVMDLSLFCLHLITVGTPLGATEDVFVAEEDSLSDPPKLRKPNDIV